MGTLKIVIVAAICSVSASCFGATWRAGEMADFPAGRFYCQTLEGMQSMAFAILSAYENDDKAQAIETIEGADQKGCFRARKEFRVKVLAVKEGQPAFAKIRFPAGLEAWVGIDGLERVETP